jgi:hypothetical protein
MPTSHAAVVPLVVSRYKLIKFIVAAAEMPVNYVSKILLDQASESRVAIDISVCMHDGKVDNFIVDFAATEIKHERRSFVLFG